MVRAPARSSSAAGSRRGRAAPIPSVAKYAWFGLLPQSGLALALALLMRDAFPTFGKHAAVLLLGVVGVNEMIAPPIFRIVMLRSGEAGKRASADFGAHAPAKGGHGRAATPLPHPP